MATFLGEARLKQLLLLIKGKFETQAGVDNKLKSYAKTTDLPTKTSDLTNDGDGTKAFLTEHQSLEEYAKTSALPTKTSQLTNDSNFVADANYTHITVDTALSSTSTNPVQNKAVKDAIDNITIPVATTSVAGKVKPDGTTITVDADGTIHGASAVDKLNDIGDVNIADAKNKQALVYNSTTQKWENADVEGGGGGGNMWVGTMQEYLAEESTIANGTNVKITNDTTEFGSNVSVAEFDFYSEEEECIGCFINGKPLYRRAFYHQGNCGAGVDFGEIPNAEFVDVVKHVAVSTSDGAMRSRFSFDATNNITDYLKTNKHLCGAYSTSIAYRDSYIVVEYTKTTDAENSFTPQMLTNKIGLENLSDADIDTIIGGIEW